jgi:RHS repeat-associated protein
VLEVHEGGDAANPLKQFVWDVRYVDAPVVRFRDGNTDGDYDDAGDDTLYYTTDANMNVTALVDTDGDVVERYAYDAYGQVTVLNGANGTDPDVDGSTVFEWDIDADGASDVANEILFAGYSFDAETGLYHVRHRMYHATLGRWIQRDPAGYVDGVGLYEYVGSRPGGKSDPTGLMWEMNPDRWPYNDPAAKAAGRAAAKRAWNTVVKGVQAAWDWLTKSPKGCDAIQAWFDDYGEDVKYGDPSMGATSMGSGASDPNIRRVRYNVSRPPITTAHNVAGTFAGAREGVPHNKELSDLAHKERPPGGGPEPTTGRGRQMEANADAAVYGMDQATKQLDQLVNTINKATFDGWCETSFGGLFTSRAGWSMGGTVSGTVLPSRHSRRLSHGEAQKVLRDWCGIEAP